jgi:hypothetical protein
VRYVKLPFSAVGTCGVYWAVVAIETLRNGP